MLHPFHLIHQEDFRVNKLHDIKCQISCQNGNRMLHTACFRVQSHQSIIPLSLQCNNHILFFARIKVGHLLALPSFSENKYLPSF